MKAVKGKKVMAAKNNKNKKESSMGQLRDLSSDGELMQLKVAERNQCQLKVGGRRLLSANLSSMMQH